MNTNKQYDVIIIGAGPSGIFCAYELIRQRPDLRILMIEKGRPIEKRVCPKRTTNVCVGCKPCSITTGFAGAGAFSDGKLSLSPDVGGNLPEILGYDKASSLIHESDEIYLKFGADTNVYGIDKQKEIEEIRRKAIGANLKLIECPIRHLGTEEGYKIYTRLQHHLLDAGVHILFRTMVQDAPKLGSAVTVKNDMRITRMGRLLRGCRLDELPQLINILKGEMSFVGTRPEVPKYVSQYTPEMMATLLLPAGVTSEASIQYKDEDRLLDGASDPDKTYVEQVLPGKMAYNLQSLRDFSFWGEWKTMLHTVTAVLH